MYFLKPPFLLRLFFTLAFAFIITKLLTSYIFYSNAPVVRPQFRYLVLKTINDISDQVTEIKLPVKLSFLPTPLPARPAQNRYWYPALPPKQPTIYPTTHPRYFPSPTNIIPTVFVPSATPISYLSPNPPTATAVPVLSVTPSPIPQQNSGSLKAVLLVAPMDGDDGSGTNQEKHNMDLAATELEANGVAVYKFYTPNNDWDQIKATAVGANFFFYRGHGAYIGLALKDHFVTSNEIRNDLHLAPNAVIMLYGCFFAGTSSSDTASISSSEAQHRVGDISDPFLDAGAAGYYSNWGGDAFQMFVHYLFTGKTLQEAYESYRDFDKTTVERYTHPHHGNMVMDLDKEYWGNDPYNPAYNNAFVGIPSVRIY